MSAIPSSSTSVDVAAPPPSPSSLVDASGIISPNSWAIVLTPSGATKTVQFKPGETVKLGKFGKFEADDLFGKPFDMPYTINTDTETAHPAPNYHFALEEFDVATEEGANNRFLNDKKESQKLTQEEIEAMKTGRGGAEGSESMLKALTANSDTYDSKTEFAKMKYLKRKQKKYAKSFIPHRPTARGLCNHFIKEAPRKICEIRHDTLSQMLTAADVRAGGRYIVIDEAAGLLTAAMMERMLGIGTLFVVHDHDVNNNEMYRFLNLPADAGKMIRNLGWTRLSQNPDEDFEKLSVECQDPKKVDRLHKRLLGYRSAREYLHAGGFDGLVMISNYNIKEILQELGPYVGASRPAVAYASTKELLVPSFLHLRSARDFINVQLTESFLREYQVLAGTHPMMRMSGNGGFLLSATKVIDCETVAATDRTNKIKKAKADEVKTELKVATESEESPEKGIKTEVNDGQEMEVDEKLPAGTDGAIPMEVVNPL
ncbi:tRNA (adenine(58)-N(1))-methyltransferase non-catalytic subunit trm6 [Thoreauomyces humboldtii]|nr:tRNA (adenine(58)-N(1))-methyltransferase non-catalytic subunit trm6 [Thoreauomyces humboldtii]